MLDVGQLLATVLSVAKRRSVPRAAMDGYRPSTVLMASTYTASAQFAARWAAELSVSAVGSMLRAVATRSSIGRHNRERSPFSILSTHDVERPTMSAKR